MENVINHALNQYTQLYSNIILWALMTCLSPKAFLSPIHSLWSALISQSAHRLWISLLSLSTLQCGTYVVYGCYGHLATADVVKLWNLKRKIYRQTERRKWNSRFNHWMWNVSSILTIVNNQIMHILNCFHITVCVNILMNISA